MPCIGSAFLEAKESFQTIQQDGGKAKCESASASSGESSILANASMSIKSNSDE